jgi:hypothetical protein
VRLWALVGGQSTLQYSLFNAADDCLAGNVGIASFEESLLLNVLFQEQLLLHEAYFFNSTLLAQHLKRAAGWPSLFEAACRRGLIVPAFRDPLTASLEQAYERMKSEDVYGTSYELLHPDMQPMRDRVLGSVAAGLQKTQPLYWPTDEKGFLGEGYLQVIRQFLQTDDPPEYAQHNADRRLLFQRVWETSKPWRFNHVEDAARLTQKKGARGLQRTDLFRLIGWSLGIPKSVMTVGVSDILDRCTDPEQRLAMTIFLKWITQCHHVNQAYFFGTAINFPVYNLNEDFIVDTLLRSPLDPGPAAMEGFRCQVKLPPLDVLLQSDPTDLVAVRSDLGAGYLFALKRWQDEPSGGNQEAVKASLREYCDQICARYERVDAQQLVATVSSGTSPPMASLFEAVGGVGGAILGIPIGIFFQCAKTMTTFYRYSRTQHKQMGRKPKSRELEVTLPSAPN